MIGTAGSTRFNCRQPDTAARNCGPGITVTAIAVIGSLVSDREDRAGGIRLDVAVDDRVVELAFEHRAERQQRHRQRLLRRRRAPGIEENDHRSLQLAVTAMPILPTSADDAERAAWA